MYGCRVSCDAAHRQCSLVQSVTAVPFRNVYPCYDPFSLSFLFKLFFFWFARSVIHKITSLFFRIYNGVFFHRIFCITVFRKRVKEQRQEYCHPLHPVPFYFLPSISVRSQRRIHTQFLVMLCLQLQNS